MPRDDKKLIVRTSLIQAETATGRKSRGGESAVMKSRGTSVKSRWRRLKGEKNAGREVERKSEGKKAGAAMIVIKCWLYCC